MDDSRRKMADGGNNAFTACLSKSEIFRYLQIKNGVMNLNIST
jgi:hypothetical protein